MHDLEKPVPSRRWWSLLVILAGTFMGTLDMFVVNVGIPSIQQNLHGTFAQVELVIAGYTLCYAVLLITGGRLGDLYGRKRLFQLGILSFTLTSLLCGLALNATMLIAFRLVQECSTALMIPQVIALIQVTFGGMYGQISCVPEDRVAFERHYRNVQIPLIKQLLGLRRYTNGRHATAIRGDEPYYWIAEGGCSTLCRTLCMLPFRI